MSGAFDLDHLVYGVPDLLAGVSQFAAATGTDPIVGGRHARFGTANYLVGLGAGTYLEIIGVDPATRTVPPRYLFGVDTVRQPRLLTWCVRTADLDASIAAARERGYDPGQPIEMSRRTSAGAALTWRLTPDTIASTGGTVPFLIDWGRSTHPTENDLPRIDLAAFTVLSPSPDETARQFAALGIARAVEYAPRAGVRAVLDTPNGPITLG